MRYDAIVVGGGPAGGNAARFLAKDGWKVLIVDKRNEIGVPVQCGEGVSGFGLERGGVPAKDEWIAQRMKGAKIVVPNGKWFVLTSRPGYSIWRDKYDQWIAYDAVAKGAELRLRTLATGVERHDGLWRVRTNRGDFEAPLLVGADGPNSNVAKWTGLWKGNAHYLRAIQIRIPEKSGMGTWGDDPDWFYIYAATKYHGGYAWVFPRGADGYNVGVGSLLTPNRMLDEFVAEWRIDASRQCEHNGGLIPHRIDLHAYARDGVAIVGDAAGMANPISGGGNHPGIWSGRVAGEVASAALEAEDPSRLARYDRLITESPYQDPVHWETMRMILGWTDADFNFVGEMIEGVDQSRMGYTHGLHHMVRRPRYLGYWRQFLRMKRAMALCQDYGW